MKEISELVKMDFEDVIRLNFEGFLDTISELSGYPLLMDISYSLEGTDGPDGQTLLIRVKGFDEENDT